VVDPEGCPFQVFECRAEGCDFEQIGGDEKPFAVQSLEPAGRFVPYLLNNAGRGFMR
jgi:hypothetical protein